MGLKQIVKMKARASGGHRFHDEPSEYHYIIEHRATSLGFGVYGHVVYIVRFLCHGSVSCSLPQYPKRMDVTVFNIP